MNIDQIAHEFPHAEDMIYLNHAAVSPLPRRTAEAIKRLADENMIHGARFYPQWINIEDKLREQLRELINAGSTEDIALVKSTSEALSIVAYGLDWQSGDNVVVAEQEFSSNRMVWESLKPLGINIKTVNLTNFDDPESILFNAIDAKTRLLTSSSVHYATGLRMDLNRLGEYCKRRQILFCVDAIQSLGAIPFDLENCQADFVMADAHKWLLGPESIALFYCNPTLRNRLRLHRYGWHMLNNPYHFDVTTWTLTETARRFECGSPNTFGIHALHASMTLFQEIGIENVYNKIINNIIYLIDSMEKIKDIRIHSPRNPTRMSSILSFSHERISNQQLFTLLQAEGLICALRGPGVRFSPHFYQNTSLLEKAVDILKYKLKAVD